MSSLTVNSFLKAYAPTAKPVAEVNAEKHRVQVGQVFCQPTKQGTNFKTCYWGFLGKDNKFISGFTMSNKLVLSMIEAGHLPKDCLATLEQFANTYAPQGKEIL
jgi:hypothetical protein